MKRILPLFSVFFLSPLLSYADGCADNVSSPDKTQSCGKNSYREADKKLNEAYRDTISRLMESAESKKKLITSQRAWIAFRDAECNFVASSVGEGSAAPMVMQGCMEDLTNKRTDDLNKYLNCPEGDLACPLPRAN